MFPWLPPIRNSLELRRSLPSLVLRAEDMWLRQNQCLEVAGAGFPLLTPTMQAGQGSHVIIYLAQKAMQGDD